MARFLSFGLLAAALVVLAGCDRGSSSSGAGGAIDGDNPPTSALVGSWAVTYTGGYKRQYTIYENGQVDFGQERKSASLKRSDELLLDFGDGKVERLSLAGSRLIVEHFNPGRNYPDKAPTEIGIGVRSSR